MKTEYIKPSGLENIPFGAAIFLNQSQTFQRSNTPSSLGSIALQATPSDSDHAQMTWFFKTK